MSKGATFMSLAALWMLIHQAEGQTDIWHYLNSPTNSTLTGVVQGLQTYVAVGRSSTFLYSEDGFIWRQGSIAPETRGDLLCVTYGNGLFVAGGTGGNLVCSSPDGTNWSVEASTTGPETVDGLAFGGGRFVGVGGSAGAAYVLSSTNGTNWSSAVLPDTNPLRAVAYGRQFVAVGDSGAIVTSSNGVEWVARSSGTERNLRAVSPASDYGNFWVAGGEQSTVIVSQDAFSWYAGAPTSFDLRALTHRRYGGGSEVLGAGNYKELGKIQQGGGTWPGEAHVFSRPVNALAVAYGSYPYAFLAVGDGGMILSSYPYPGPAANSWTNPVSGYWQDPHWSLGELPAYWNRQVLFTNAGSKTLVIGGTAMNYPQSLMIRSLVVDAPEGFGNELLFTNGGSATPVKVTGEMFIGTNASLINWGSILEADTLDVRSRAVFGNEGESRFRRVSLGGPAAEMVLSNGLFSASELLAMGYYGFSIFYDSPAKAVFTQYGGTNQSQISLSASAYNLVNGTLSGSLSLYGGRFTAFGGTVVSPRIYLSDFNQGEPEVWLWGANLAAESVWIQSRGTFVQGGGVSDIQGLNTQGEYRLIGGRLVTGSVYDGGINQTGGAHLNRNQIQVGSRHYNFSGGLLETPKLSVAVGSFVQGSGTTNHAGLLHVWQRGTFRLEGGELYTSSTQVDSNSYATSGIVRQTGGFHTADEIRAMAGGVYEIQNGALFAKSIWLDSAGEVRLVGGRIERNELVVFAAGSLMTAGAREFGEMVLTNSGTSRIQFVSGSSATLRFQDSHARGWSPEGRLQIWDWNGTRRVFVGTNANGLTADQLRQVAFMVPAGFGPGMYPARILETGELMPTGVAIPVTIAFNRWNTNLVLSWPEGFKLYTAFRVTGPYFFRTSESPYTNSLLSPKQFFLLRLP